MHLQLLEWWIVVFVDIASFHRGICTLGASLIAIFTGLFCGLKFESYSSHTKISNAISEILPTGIIIFVYIIFFPGYKFETVDVVRRGPTHHVPYGSGDTSIIELYTLHEIVQTNQIAAKVASRPGGW